MNSGNDFFAELKRRNVYKVGAAYVVVGWLLIQVATQVFPFFDIPNWAVRLVVLAIIIGFPIALVIAWAFELTPEGIKRTDDAGADGGGTARPRSRTWLYVVAGAATVSIGLFFLGRFSAAPPAEKATEMPAKSIAVRPFENLSDDKANAYFASGIQDEILTKLAKIGALKVISRSSTRQYESKPGNLRDIGQQLGVANILEGSVQKAGEVVHINVQLIRAATDEHLWAESYSRNLADIFAVQTELAAAIAEALKAKLTGAEEKALETRPTTNVAAYAAYLRGRAIETESYDYASFARGAAEYLEAVRLDPRFALAWARLANLRSFLYFNGIDLAANSAAAVKQAADQAFTLQADLPEAWMAQGVYRYRVLRDFSGAAAAFEEARRRMPNNSDVLAQMALVERRLGRWTDAQKHCREALEVDPRNVGFLTAFGGELYLLLRSFAEAHAQIDRALRIAPGNASALAYKAFIYQAEGRLAEAAKVITQIAPDERDETVVETSALQFIYERRFDAALARLAIVTSAPKSGEPPSGHAKALLSLQGYCDDWAGQRADARATFERAVREIKPVPESIVPVDSTYLPMNLALAYAGLDEKQRAFDAAHAAIAAYENDAISKSYAETVLAQIQARFGEVDAAIAALPHLLQVPAVYPLTPAILRLDPMWDPLRKDPRFQKLCEDKQP